jgi:cyclohexanecarboxyl-CoA dehydrogenase
MDFSFTEEQESFRKVIRDYSLKELLPHYKDRAKKQGDFNREVYKALASMGLTSLRIPEEYGGSQTDFVTWGIAAEELARGDFNLGATGTVLSGLGASLIETAGAEALKREWLPQIVRGDVIVGFAITEPDSGTDAAAMRTRATKSGTDYILTGEKTSVTFTMADAFVVFAKTSPDKRARGVTAFLVPRNTPGVSTSEFNDMGMKPCGRGSLFLDDARVPQESVLGEVDRGFHLIMNRFDFVRSLIALMCVGAADQSIEETVEYAKDRRAFGQPIAKFEAVSFRIAEYHTLLEAGRLLSYKALWLRDQGLDHTVHASMAKWWVPKVAAEALWACVLTHGHYGYTDEFPHEQRFRDVSGLQIGDGTAEAQKIVISRELFGRDYLPYQHTDGGVGAQS